MEPKNFYKQLRSISWQDGTQLALDFLRKNRNSLSAKSPEGATVIQTLMSFEDADDENYETNVDNVICEVIDLMDRKALDDFGEFGQTSLFAAVGRERQRVVEKLLSRKADVWIRDKKRERLPLHLACYRGNLDIVRILHLHDETQTRCQDQEGSTPLDLACWRGHPDVVRYMLSQDSEPLHMTDYLGKSPLYTATENGHLEIVQTLLAKVDILEKADKMGTTPLDRACELGFNEIVTLLIESGAQIECRDQSGYTPFLTACTCGQLDTVNLLIGRGAIQTALTYENESCLSRATSNGHSDIVSRLLELEDMQDLLDVPAKNGTTPLVIACRYGRTDIVSSLLASGADRMATGTDGNSPLMEAGKWRYGGVAKLLLEHVDETPRGVDALQLLNQKNKEDGDFSALHYACLNGHLATIKLLLKYGANVNDVDGEGRNSLHNACRQGYKEVVEFLCTKVQDINAVDERGWTALHHASWNRIEEDNLLSEDDLGHEPYPEAEELSLVPGKHAEILQHLLKVGAEMTLTAGTKSTAVHLASEQGNHSRVSILLGNLQRVEEVLCLKNSDNKTALCLAMERKNGHVVRQLLDRMSIADFGETEDKEDLMLWMAKRPETHSLARLLLSKDNPVGDLPPSAAQSWGALEWATYRGYPGLVWWLLFTSDPSPERDRKIRAAEVIASRFASRQRVKGHNTGAKRNEPNTTDNRQDQLDDTERKHTNSSARETGPEDNHAQVLMILHNPPMTQTVGQRQRLTQASDKPIYQPHSIELINHYMANVVDCYGFQDRSGFLRRFATIKDVIYTRGPAQIMGEARERTYKLDSKYGPRDGTAANAWTEDDVKVRWIHLPANNMKWMSDLALTVSPSSDIDGSGLSWLDRSWDQVVGNSLSSSFMRPKCVYRMQQSNSDDLEEDDDDDDDDDEAVEDVDEDDENEANDAGDDIDGVSEESGDGPTQAAIYMPYLTVAKHSRNGRDLSPEYERLLDDYKDEVIQGSRTLDEFFYHSCEDDNLQIDIHRRNGDQVLSKNIHGSVSHLDSWALLNVDQVWIWVIDNKTIVTSSTHRRDDVEDPLLTAVLEKMSHSNETTNGNRGPTNTFEMSRLIVDTCIDFFDREVQMSIETQPGQPATGWNGSVHDVFTSALAKAAMKEAALYDQYAANEGSNLPERPGKLGSNQKRTEILEAAHLFREIKDIRDELKMLRTIAEHQMSVQKDAPELPSSANTSSAESIATGLREMDKSATRIENAVNTTLNLEQNGISIAQAQEAANQGRTLMLFTVVTILFLPMSFFTSLFALDVASFQQTPAWAFVVLFCVSFAIFIPLAMYAVYSDSLTVWHARLLGYFRGAESPKSNTLGALAWNPSQVRPTFRTDQGTIGDFSKSSTDVVNEHARGRLTRRRRVRTQYDEESLKS